MDSRHSPRNEPKGADLAAATSDVIVPGVRGGLSGDSGEPEAPKGGTAGPQAEEGRQTTRGDGSLVSVTGYVLPDAWGENFEVSGVLIADDRERELVVGNVAEHPALLELCRRKVTATGWLAARDGRLLFTVREFAVADAAG
jgi:hypothetical protein